MMAVYTSWPVGKVSAYFHETLVLPWNECYLGYKQKHHHLNYFYHGLYS